MNFDNTVYPYNKSTRLNLSSIDRFEQNSILFEHILLIVIFSLSTTNLHFETKVIIYGTN